MRQTIGAHLLHLSPSQLTGLTWWVCGTVWAGSPPPADQNAVAAALSMWGSWHSRRQYLREWLYDGSDPPQADRTELDVSLCFAPLLKWVLSWWCGNRLALAIDPRLKGDDAAAIVISVRYRGCAIPVVPYPVRGRLWRILPAKRPGSWMDPIVELLQALAPAVPGEMTVIVLCDRGLNSPKLWRQIRAQSLPRTGYGGWHPYVRYPKNITFCAEGGRSAGGGPAQTFVSRPDTAWVGNGAAFKSLPRTGYGGRAKRRCTLLVVWCADQLEPWIILTDQPPEAVGVSWYGLRLRYPGSLIEGDLGQRASPSWGGDAGVPADAGSETATGASAGVQPGLQCSCSHLGVGPGGGHRQSVPGEPGSGAGEGGPVPGRTGPPKSGGETALPDGTPVAGRGASAGFPA